ncbi:MAG: PAS domain S-box protein, partial [Pseudomonadota bacterium]
LMSKKTFYRLLIAGFGLGVMGVLAGIGFWAGDVRGKSVEAEMREQLLYQVQTIARTINPRLVKKLTFTKDDKGSPVFEHLSEQMITFAKNIPHCGLYSLALRQGQPVFGLEDYSKDHPLAGQAGSVNKKPPEEFLQIFKDKIPATVGPYTVEHASLVSVAAPVVDPQTGAVIMLVALDILTPDWHARGTLARRQPIIKTLIVILLLLGGTVFVLRCYRKREQVNLKLTVWIVAPVTIAILCVSALLIFYLQQQKNEETRRDMQKFMRMATRESRRHVFSQTQMLQAQMDHIDRSPELREAWRSRDFEALAALSQPICEKLRREFKITHFYFINPDRTCFLRAYNPEKRGGLINRYTLLTAEQTGEDAWGLELGSLGTFTLRYVRPWMQDGKCLGYIELGMEIEHLFSDIADDLHEDLMIVIKKTYTTRENFEAGRKAFGFAGQWEDFPEVIVPHKKFLEIPAELRRLFSESRTKIREDKPIMVRDGDMLLQCGAINFPDAAGRNVAEFIMVREVTTNINLSRSRLILNLSLAVVLFAGVIVLLWSVTVTAAHQIDIAFKALRTSERRYQLLFEGNRDGLVSIDTGGKFIDANSSYCSMLGYSLEELREIKSFYSITPPRCWKQEDKETWNSQLLKSGYTAVTEKEYIGKDGSIFPVELQAFSVFDENKNIQYLWCVARDISERKHKEAELTRLSLAVEQASETVEIMNPDGIIQYVNRAVELLYEKPREEIIGKDSLNYHLDNKKDILIWQEVIAGKTEKIIFSKKKKDGSHVNLELTIKPVYDEGGDIISIVSIGRDITKENQLEEQLRQSQKMEAIGTLSGGIAHDFNNILTGIIGFAEIAKDKVAQDTRSVYYLDQILKLSGRAANLVQQILTFSRKKRSSRKSMQLSPLIKEMLTLLQATLPSIIEIRQKLLDQGSMVEADPTQIHQVLMNLCTNAYHAMQETGGVLEIELTRVSVNQEDITPYQDIKPGPFVLLKVNDTGEGIDPAIINRIFDPFFTTKDVGKGTGLGLSVVHGIIKDHGGDIAVISEPGKGTTFSILLPEATSLSEAALKKKNNGILSGNEYILFVDDEEALTGLATMFLEPLGYKVMAVQSGQEALDLFQKAPETFDLVITDLSMPQMTGYELAQRLIEIRPEIPVILCTGYNDTIFETREKELSIKAVLIKPFNRRALAETIRKVLPSKQSQPV